MLDPRPRRVRVRMPSQDPGGSRHGEQLRAVMAQIRADAAAGALVWLPVSDAVVKRVEAFFTDASPSVILHAADALHLPAPWNMVRMKSSPTTSTCSKPPPSSTSAV